MRAFRGHPQANFEFGIRAGDAAGAHITSISGTPVLAALLSKASATIAALSEKAHCAAPSKGCARCRQSSPRGM